MLTLIKIRSQIEEALNINSDDSTFDYRLYDDLVSQKRAKWLRFNYEKNRTYDESLTQTFCMDLELVNKEECCDLGFTTNCKVLRTVQKLPTPIELKFSDGILDVRPATLFTISFTKIDYSRLSTVKYSRWNTSTIYVFRYKDRLYFYSGNPKHLLMEKVLVRGIFLDPLEGAKLGCTGSCVSEEDDYPMSAWFFDQFVKPDVVQELMGRYRLSKDESNDGKDRELNLQSDKKTKQDEK